MADPVTPIQGTPVQPSAPRPAALPVAPTPVSSSPSTLPVTPKPQSSMSSQQVFPPSPKSLLSPQSPPTPQASSLSSTSPSETSVGSTLVPPIKSSTQPQPPLSGMPMGSAPVLQTKSPLPITAPIPIKIGVGGAPLQTPPSPQKIVAEAPTPISPKPMGGTSVSSGVKPSMSSMGTQSTSGFLPQQPQSSSSQSSQKPSQSPQKLPQSGVKMASPGDVKQSPFKFLPIILGVLALVGLVWFLITKFFGGASTSQTASPKTAQQASTPAPVKQTTVTYWGLWEPSPVMDQVLKDFSTANPGVVVNYVQQSPKDYRERLADALKKGTGPDVFRYHATWVPMLKSNLSTIPSSVMSADEYTKTFYPIVSKQLKTTDGFVGIPLMYDGLALYYNKQIFTTANLPAPTSWAEIESAARALTVRSKDKKIDRAGIALGTTANVDNFSDVLGLLILQNGGDPSQPATKLVADSVKYYTNFYRSLKVWDETLPNSTYAFATEKVAMMIAPSWRAFEVKAINPNIQFAIAPVPQLPGTSIAWASYWVEGVSKTSKQQDVAWKLLKYMSSKDVLLKLHESAASKTPRLFGEIYPRVDMASTMASDPYVSAFLSDAPKATSWWMASRTFDNGINDKIIKYYEDAINAVNLGTSTPDEALKTTQQGVQQVLSTQQ